jgi:hypothetical protein
VLRDSLRVVRPHGRACQLGFYVMEDGTAVGKMVVAVG